MLELDNGKVFHNCAPQPPPLPARLYYNNTSFKNVPMNDEGGNNKIHHTTKEK
jgi:hypothetical protein